MAFGPDDPEERAPRTGGLGPSSWEKSPGGIDVPEGTTAAAASVTPPSEGGGFVRKAFQKAQDINQWQQGLGARRALADQRLANNQTLNKRQMAGTTVRTAIGNMAANQQVFNEFKHAGMGAAIRYAVGAPAMPSNLWPYARAHVLAKAEGQPPEPLTGEREGGAADEED